MDHPTEHEKAEERASANSYGSLFSILLMVLVIVFGAFYVWQKRINQDRLPVPATADQPIAPVEATTSVSL